jgi:hypothetical protein
MTLVVTAKRRPDGTLRAANEHRSQKRDPA